MMTDRYILEAEGDDLDNDVPELPKPQLAAHPGHDFKKITNVGRGGSELTNVVGDGPVSVRGPDKRQIGKDRQNVVAVFNFRDKAKAMTVRQELLDGKLGLEVPKVDGPRPARIDKEKKYSDPGNLYYQLSATVFVPEDSSSNELIRKLKSRKASDVLGPFKEPGAARFELTVQKRSGATETMMFKSEEEANKAKEDIEKGIRDNPIKGVTARRVAPGVSTIANQGLSRNRFFSDTAVLSRKHYDMLKKDPERGRYEIARDIGLTLALTGVPGTIGDEARLERNMLVKKIGQEKANLQIKNAESQLDDYIKRVKQSPTTRSGADMEKLKPQFKGSFEGQRHTVKGRLQHSMHRYVDPKTGELKKASRSRESRSPYEFIWSNKFEDWFTPLEYAAKRRGDELPTKKRAEAEPVSFDPSKNDRKKGMPGKETGVGPRRQVVPPEAKAYVEQYLKVFNAVAKYYSDSPLTNDFAEALQGIIRTVKTKGSPTRQSLDKLEKEVENMRSKYEKSGESLTITGKEKLQHAIAVGKKLVAQPPPEYDEYDYGAQGEEEPDQDFAKAASKAARLGIAKGGNEPKSKGHDFKEPRMPGRQQVLTAPGLPTKMVEPGKAPPEYRSHSKDWADLDNLLRGADDSEFSGAKDSDAMNALRSKINARNTSSDDPNVVVKKPVRKAPPASKSFTVHPGPTRKSPNGNHDKIKNVSPDTPWRALAKLQGDDQLDDQEDDNQ